MARPMSLKYVLAGLLAITASVLLVVLIGPTASATSAPERAVERFDVLSTSEPSGFAVGDSAQEMRSLRGQGQQLAVQDTGTGPDFRAAREARGIQGARVWVAPNQSDEGVCILSMAANTGVIGSVCGGEETFSNGVLEVVPFAVELRGGDPVISERLRA